jgi:hypothetical protein
MAPGSSEVMAALGSWSTNEAALLGVFESRELEFKKTAYRLDENKGKTEFAKDIAGMANAGGGVIILGIETERDATVGRDKSIRIRRLAPGSCDISQMEEVARTWIYPPYRGLEIHEWPGADDQLLVSVHVAGFPDLGGLALVLGPGTPSDRRTVGVPLRSESRVDFHSAPEIYEWIRRGRLQAALGTAPEVSAEPKRDADVQMKRVREEFVVAAASGAAVFWLQAWPDRPTRLERIFDRDGVKGMFLDPPPHRAAGFNFWEIQPDVDAAGGIRVSSGENVALWITPSSVATLVVGQEYLTWAMDQYNTEKKGPLINPTAVSEFVYEFVRMYSLLSSWCDPPIVRVPFRIGVFQATEPLALRLSEGRPRPFFGFQGRKAPNNELMGIVGPVDLHEGDTWAQEVTVLILRRFYELFGWGREAIPHLTVDGQRFDPESLNRR